MNSVTTPFWQTVRNKAYWVGAMTYFLVAHWPATAIAAPLTSEQQSRALKLANEIAWPVANSGNSADDIEDAQGTPTFRIIHTLGIQTVSIEQDVIKNNSTHQQARVYQYSYPNYSARVVVVSLANNQVIKQSLIQSVHLPLTQAEHEYALTVLSADTDAITLLKADQQRRGRTPFAHIEELSVKASIYKPLSQGHPCIHERCALLSLFDHSNTVFSSEPIVNLQHGAVMWLER